MSCRSLFWLVLVWVRFEENKRKNKERGWSLRGLDKSTMCSLLSASLGMRRDGSWTRFGAAKIIYFVGVY